MEHLIPKTILGKYDDIDVLTGLYPFDIKSKYALLENKYNLKMFVSMFLLAKHLLKLERNNDEAKLLTEKVLSPLAA